MGIEMIERAGRTFERKHRRGLNAMEAPDLFTGALKLNVALLAQPNEGCMLKEGKRYRLVRQDCIIHVVEGVTAIAAVLNPPQSVLDTMQLVLPSAIGYVSKRFEMSGDYEIVLESP